MSATKTCALWNEHRRQQERMTKELDAVARAEFPPGTRVRWVHTFARGTHEPVYREGVVHKWYGYEQVEVRMRPDGPNHRLYCHLLDIVAPAPGVTP